MGKPVVLNPGDTRGRWTLIEPVAESKPARWLCKCSCGTKKTVLRYQLVAGASKSCGCLSADIHRKAIKGALEFKGGY